MRQSRLQSVYVFTASIVLMTSPAAAQRADSVVSTFPVDAADPGVHHLRANLDPQSSLPTSMIQQPPPPRATDASSPAELARVLSEVVYESIPRTYEKAKDWDRKKAITLGFRAEGQGIDLRIRRRKKDVRHGTWKRYRISMVEPAKNLDVQIENLRSLNAGQIAFTLVFESQLDAWAQARFYNRGIHFITLSVEGNTSLCLKIECKVSLKLTPSAMLTGLEVVPRVTDAQLELDDFELTRISKLNGPLVRELGKGLRHLVEEKLEGPELVAKLNRAIDKKRHRLRFAPDALIELPQSANKHKRIDGQD